MLWSLKRKGKLNPIMTHFISSLTKYVIDDTHGVGQSLSIRKYGLQLNDLNPIMVERVWGLKDSARMVHPFRPPLGQN